MFVLHVRVKLEVIETTKWESAVGVQVTNSYLPGTFSLCVKIKPKNFSSFVWLKKSHAQPAQKHYVGIMTWKVKGYQLQCCPHFLEELYWPTNPWKGTMRKLMRIHSNRFSQIHLTKSYSNSIHKLHQTGLIFLLVHGGPNRVTCLSLQKSCPFRLFSNIVTIIRRVKLVHSTI